MSRKFDLVVVDSGPFIKGAMLRNFAKHAVSVPGVIKEIKDVHTRNQIRNLPPFFFEIINPSKEAMSHVIAASKKSGDFNVLSRVDLELLALSYQLSSTPEDKLSTLFKSINLNSTVEFKENQSNDNDNFFFMSEQYVEGEFDVTDDEEDEDEENEEDEDNNKSECNEDDEVACENEENSSENDKSEEIDEECLLEDSDDGEWVTPKNKTKRKDGDVVTSPIDETINTKIGCLSTDYALQNVLMHLNIPVLSISGMIIKEARIYVSYCRSCQRVHRRPDIYFCTWCGHSNIGRIPAIMKNGEFKLFFKKNWQPNLRNCVFSVPNPQSGKHTSDKTYIYCADQRLPQERPKQPKASKIALDEGLGFFGMVDIQSRAANLGITKEQVLRPTAPKCLTKNKKLGKRRRKKH